MSESDRSQFEIKGVGLKRTLISSFCTGGGASRDSAGEREMATVGTEFWREKGGGGAGRPDSVTKYTV